MRTVRSSVVVGRASCQQTSPHPRQNNAKPYWGQCGRNRSRPHWLHLAQPQAHHAVTPGCYALSTSGGNVVALQFGLLASVTQPYPWAGNGVVQHVREPRGAERPQDYGDLVRLVSTLQALEVREPGQQAIRDALLTKLTAASMGGQQGGGWSQEGH